MPYGDATYASDATEATDDQRFDGLDSEGPGPDPGHGQPVGAKLLVALVATLVLLLAAGLAFADVVVGHGAGCGGG